jgi:hypothetical protein
VEERVVTAEILARLLREAEAAHAQYEATLGRRDEDWPSWYARYIIERLPNTEREPEEIPSSEPYLSE